MEVSLSNDLPILILFLICVYIVGFIVSGFYSFYRKIKYNEKILLSKVFLEPLYGVSEVFGYIFATVVVFYFSTHWK